MSSGDRLYSGGLALGAAVPDGQPYSILASMPTWESIKLYLDEDGDFFKTLQWAYPRGMLTEPLRTLRQNILSRLSISDPSMTCITFASSRACSECMEALSQALPGKADAVHMLTFSIATADGEEATGAWSSFSTLLYPSDLEKHMMDFWRDSGKVMSPRHAQYCADNLHLMKTDSTMAVFRTAAPSARTIERPLLSVAPPLPSSTSDDYAVRSFIADLITSEQPGQPKVEPSDVFLYPTGMTAVYTLSQALASLADEPVVVAFGWLYLEIVDLLRRRFWTRVIPFRDTTEAALDALEALLASGQQRIHALFCEFPSSVKLECPNMERIRTLAKKYDFIVACDETMGNFVNVDVLPYADVVVSSLTKIFSGAANVMGGSVVVNPSSEHHAHIQSAIKAHHEDIYFPLDLRTVRKNSADLVGRVHRSNKTTLAVLPLFTAHPAVRQLFFPPLVHSHACYEKCKRREGGYGNTIIVIFRDARAAAQFYNRLGCIKTASFGTNFTMAVPYGELTYSAWDAERCAKYGLPKHLIRLNIGLEHEEVVRGWFGHALQGIGE